jgi:hypothetical protein
VLRALYEQDDPAFEVVVTDGSGRAADVVRRWWRASVSC